MAAIGLAALGGGTGQTAPRRPPNILFIIMDDVGIDQMPLFGYGGLIPPRMPTVQQIARSGVRFGNTWAMPACTTSRAVFFTGRFPLRTNAFGALGPSDLANSHVSPFETTAPKLLKQKGYQSALFGKFHLALQGNNPYSYSMVRSLGWDYFYGWLDETGDPSSIDTTAGGVAAPGTWRCGFVPGEADGGADEGACYAADNTCQNVSSSGPIPPGRTCRDRGGIFDPGKQCQSDRPEYIDFETLNGHYVSPLTIDHEDGTLEQVPSTDIRARTFRGTAVVDAAIDWIRRQPADRPWMASVSFASAHTPLMHPPPALLPPGAAGTSCAADDDDDDDRLRILTNQMIEAMDTEIARLLVSTALAGRGPDGRLIYRPEDNGTLIVILGDNGSLGTTVKFPFDITRSKGTAYQTGVWVPLVVAGPLVEQPDRNVPHMVNVADLYQLFGEVAGIDVARSVPRTIDSASMLPYLVNPRQRSIRRSNFTQVAPNLQAGGTRNGPCTIEMTCTQIPVTRDVCEDNGGTWWGPGADDPDLPPGIPPEGLENCCEVNRLLGRAAFSIQPVTSMAVRNERYKIVRNFFEAYEASDNSCTDTETDEFYEIDEAAPMPKLDTRNRDLNAQGPLTPRQRANYNALSRELEDILASQPLCEGDGNIDGVVDERDIEDWEYFAGLANGKSSWYDLNGDGLTDAVDLQIIQDNLGTRCGKK